MITIIDYGVCNTGSILNMLTALGVNAEVTNKQEKIKAASKLILPGIGSFDTGVKSLKEANLWEILDQKIKYDKTPLLGICLGMQLLTNHSDEGLSEGFGWVDAETIQFQPSEKLAVPHMRWNNIHIEHKNYLTNNIDNDSRFYFSHSHYVKCKSNANVIASSKYGVRFHSVINHDNIWGTQFHPEKSHKFGMTLLNNFSQKC